MDGPDYPAPITPKSIQCNASGNACQDTKLTLKAGSSEPTTPLKPKGIEKYSAVGLACAKATDGTRYFVVQYGDMPRSYAVCEWFSLYDLHGKPLTNNNPSILIDHDMPPAQQASPNNSEFDALSKKIGLGRPDMQYIR